MQVQTTIATTTKTRTAARADASTAAPNEAPAPEHTIRFPGGFDDLPTVGRGERVRIEVPHDAARAFVAGPAYQGRDTWTGRVMMQVSPQGQYLGHQARPVELQIPSDAHDVQIWLELRGTEGLRHYSNFGANFRLPLAGPAQPTATEAAARALVDTGSVSVAAGGIDTAKDGASSLWALRLRGA
jgi:hypothetical protein